jgi:hypothetical protein
VRYAGTDEVHAARSHSVSGHRTVCLLWLNPENPHVWCAKDAEVTCTKCIERMGPPPLKYPPPGTMGTLQERLAEVIESEVPTGYFDWAKQRVAETVESWRRDAEEQVRLAVSEVLVDFIPDTNRSDAARNMTEAVLRSMDIGSNVTNEGGQE